MNKNVSLAIEKAVGSINKKNQNEFKNNGPKKPDLFSLSGRFVNPSHINKKFSKRKSLEGKAEEFLSKRLGDHSTDPATFLNGYSLWKSNKNS